MPISSHRAFERAIHPVHAVLLAGTIPLFLGTLLSDWAYWSTYEVQWINFASWLIVGALLFLGFALLWAVIDFFRAGSLRPLYLIVLLTTFVVGFINALVHGKDVWATMPAGLILSVLVFLLALASVWLGFSAQRKGAAQ